MNIKTKEFLTFYSPDCRKRHFHKRIKNDILEFVIQLEIYFRNKWHAIIRYDTSHKFAHCDILHWTGKTEKIAMPTLDFKEAIFYADEDLNQNWETYRKRFIQEVYNNE